MCDEEQDPTLAGGPLRAGAGLAKDVAAQINALVVAAVEGAYTRGRLRGLREGFGDAAMAERLAAAAARIRPMLVTVTERFDIDVPPHHRPGTAELAQLLEAVATFGHKAASLLERGAWTVLHTHLASPLKLTGTHHGTARALRNVSSPLAPLVANAVSDAREVLNLADSLAHQISARLASGVSGNGTLVVDGPAGPAVTLTMSGAPTQAAAAAAVAHRHAQMRQGRPA